MPRGRRWSRTTTTSPCGSARNYKPTQYTGAITESVLAGAPPYPMDPQSALAHAALGDNIADFLGGKESAEQSLADAARSYRSAAIDAGLMAQ